jgi:hypothetical protein
MEILEARVQDKTVIVYKVHGGVVPKDFDDAYKYAELLVMCVFLKRRIRKTTALVAACRQKK